VNNQQEIILITKINQQINPNWRTSTRLINNRNTNLGVEHTLSSREQGRKRKTIAVEKASQIPSTRSDMQDFGARVPHYSSSGVAPLWRLASTNLPEMLGPQPIQHGDARRSLRGAAAESRTLASTGEVPHAGHHQTRRQTHLY
jgi:hypothetical protein